MTSWNCRTKIDPDAVPQSGFALDDPDSRTRSPQLQVVYAQALRAEPLTPCPGG